MNVFAWLHETSLKHDLSFLIIGGYAVSAYGHARFTRDLDLLIPRMNVEKWISISKTAGYVVHHKGENFLQLTSAQTNASPLDLVLTTEATFTQMKAAAKEARIENVHFLVPCLDHLLALKLHALKYGPPHRGFKDFTDILSMVEANRIDLRSERFRALCEKYGDQKTYERILAFGPS